MNMPKYVVGGWAVSAAADSAPTIASVVNSASKRLFSADKSAVDGDLYAKDVVGCGDSEYNGPAMGHLWASR